MSTSKLFCLHVMLYSLFQPDTSFDLYSRIASIENRLIGLDDRINLLGAGLIGGGVIFLLLGLALRSEMVSTSAAMEQKMDKLEIKMDKQRLDDIDRATKQRLDDIDRATKQRLEDINRSNFQQAMTLAVAIIPIVMGYLANKK